jgi:hypothetical protein
MEARNDLARACVLQNSAALALGPWPSSVLLCACDYTPGRDRRVRCDKFGVTESTVRIPLHV